VDESTFGSFYESTKDSLWRYIAKMTKNEMLARDIFQDSYVRFLHSGVEHQDDARKKSYLFQIATNLMRDLWRREKRERLWMEEEPAREPSTSGGDEINIRIDVGKALDGLSRQHCSLLWLAYVEHYEHREIAHMLKIRETSVRVLLFRAKQRFIEICRRMGITQESI
jgi:RNA polymerase sigma factor (sigma-70 family)